MGSALSRAAAAEKIECVTSVNEFKFPAVSAELTQAQTRLFLRNLKGTMFFATIDSSSNLITLDIIDTKTNQLFESRGALGRNGDGVTLVVPHKGKHLGISCAAAP